MRLVYWFLAAAFVFAMISLHEARAANCSTYPYTLQNGQTADANQVMANFNSILSCANTNLATAGANSNITSLSGLSTAISIAQGGTGATTQSGAQTALGIGTAGLQASSYFLQSANNLSDLTNAGTARTNLGLGNIATYTQLGSGTYAATVTTSTSGNFSAFTISGALAASGYNQTSFDAAGSAAAAQSNAISTSESYTNSYVSSYASSNLLFRGNNLSDVSSAGSSRANIGAANVVVSTGAPDGRSANTGDIWAEY